MDLSPTLMRAAGPYAIIVLALNLAAVAQSRDNLDGVQVDHPAGPIVALEEFGLQRSLTIAAIQLAFAIYLLWAARRRSPGVMALTGLVTGLYEIGLLCLHWFNPIAAFPIQGFASPPFVGLDPPWYYPALSLVLLAAAVTQLVALVLAIRSSDWRLVGRGSLLLLGPLLAVTAYAVLNLVAIQLATEPRTPTDIFGLPWTESSRDSLIRRAEETTVLLGRWLLPLTLIALPLSWLGWRMLRRGVTSAMMVPTCMLSVPYLAFLGLFTWLQPLSNEMNYDDQTGYIDQSPAWHPIALVVLLVIAIAAQATGLARTSKST
ncbi:hypothetical protein [Nonomuraea sp. 10N515B]|uniref:hypothetical protein n=1 Tax=Nonomuraea sp. 10N515B TaxID=3457422 RepID=UPI003FCE0174